jgi:hypothetical protein
LIGSVRLRAESHAKLPGIANFKNVQILVAEGGVSRNLLQFLAFTRDIFPSHSLSIRLLLPTAPLSVLLMPEEYNGGQDPGVLGTDMASAGTTRQKSEADSSSRSYETKIVCCARSE